MELKTDFFHSFLQPFRHNLEMSLQILSKVKILKKHSQKPEFEMGAAPPKAPRNLTRGLSPRDYNPGPIDTNSGWVYSI